MKARCRAQLERNLRQCAPFVITGIEKRNTCRSRSLSAAKSGGMSLSIQGCRSTSATLGRSLISDRSIALMRCQQGGETCVLHQNGLTSSFEGSARMTNFCTAMTVPSQRHDLHNIAWSGSICRVTVTAHDQVMVNPGGDSYTA